MKPAKRFRLLLVLFLCLISWSPAWAEKLTTVKEVGPLKVTATLSPEQPVIGDQITLEIVVDAQKNVEVLMPEFGEALDRYRILDFVPRKKIHDDGSSTYRQRYTIQPHSSGPQSISPILVEFVDNRPGQKASPDDLDAYEILTDRIDFAVKSVLPASASNELKPPLGELTLESEEQLVNQSWILPAVIFVVVTAGIVGVIFLRRWRRQATKRNAYEVARARLDKLLAGAQTATEEQIEDFYVAISAIVRRYLEDRFELRAPDLTTEEFLELAAEAGNLSFEHQALLRDFLRQADMVKFAGVSASSDDIVKSTELTKQFLEETRQDAPLIETDESESREVVNV